MDSVLALEIAVGVFAALNLHRDALYAGFIAVLKVADGDLVAVGLGPTLIHTHEHLRPVLALRAAGTAVYLHHHVHRVFFLTQHVLHFKALNGLDGTAIVFVNLFFRDHLVLVEVESQLKLVGSKAHFVVSVNPPFDAFHLLHLLFRPLRVFPKVGCLSAKVLLLKFNLLTVYVKIAAQCLGTLHDVFKLVCCYHNYRKALYSPPMGDTMRDIRDDN